MPIVYLTPNTSTAAQPRKRASRRELMDQLNAYDEFLQHVDRKLYMNNMKIIIVVLKHLNKKIERKILSVHSNYSAMLDAIKKFDKDR